eukprot:gnl/TRDRNA2_/TRDRNA2_86267_c0_seq1.p1 gnl/TRDRNA2_/TRDRNA2_86267_c0~~gnl/TRDRNA2_/TRDRNA2_86267_c0_seq1.p1  ORF type:complete len:455 (+),score=58.37 gnl/TRDRNA2_/TRDRNA2_86267_c0_seq1:167-1366(+)
MDDDLSLLQVRILTRPSRANESSDREVAKNASKVAATISKHRGGSGEVPAAAIPKAEGREIQSSSLGEWLEQHFLGTGMISMVQRSSWKHATDHQQCQLLGDFASYFLQLALFCICFGSLLIKWRLERPLRSLRVFLLDSSKQIVGVWWLHVLNLISSFILNTNSMSAYSDECAWYWTNLMMDTTVGLLVLYTTLWVTERLFGYQSGVYHSTLKGSDREPTLDYSRWFLQLAAYLCICTAQKITVLIIISASLPYSASVGIWATSWIQSSSLRLVFVMAVTPLVMNTFYFWATDGHIKYTAPKFKDDPTRANCEQPNFPSPPGFFSAHMLSDHDAAAYPTEARSSSTGENANQHGGVTTSLAPRQQGEFQCPYCKQRYETAKALGIHTQFIHGIKNFKK